MLSYFMKDVKKLCSEQKDERADKKKGVWSVEQEKNVDWRHGERRKHEPFVSS